MKNKRQAGKKLFYASHKHQRHKRHTEGRASAEPNVTQDTLTQDLGCYLTPTYTMLHYFIMVSGGGECCDHSLLHISPFPSDGMKLIVCRHLLTTHHHHSPLKAEVLIRSIQRASETSERHRRTQEDIIYVLNSQVTSVGRFTPLPIAVHLPALFVHQPGLH